MQGPDRNIYDLEETSTIADYAAHAYHFVAGGKGRRVGRDEGLDGEERVAEAYGRGCRCEGRERGRTAKAEEGFESGGCVRDGVFGHVETVRLYSSPSTIARDRDAVEGGVEHPVARYSHGKSPS